jgi:hypothetical protein
MTTYETTVEHYGPSGLINSEVIHNILTGEDEQRHLSPARLQQAYSTLRSWSDDAETTHTDWPTMTAGQKDAAMREVIQRLGLFFDRFADLLLIEGRS